MTDCRLRLVVQEVEEVPYLYVCILASDLVPTALYSCTDLGPSSTQENYGVKNNELNM